MNKEALQQAMLMAQLDKKRALKQKYLQQAPGSASLSPLTEQVMTNVMLRAIRGRVDIFTHLRRLRQEATAPVTFDTAVTWLSELAEALDCGVYELFIQDIPRQQKIVFKLLEDLRDCDSWENIRSGENGQGSFLLVGFDHAYRIAERPSASLLFEKTAAETGFRYTLTLGDGWNDPSGIPSYGVLWQEEQGPLCRFIDRVLEEVGQGWPAFQQQFGLLLRQLARETETLQDLCRVLEEVPQGLDISSLLRRERETLLALHRKTKELYSQMPQGLRRSGRGKQAENTLILLGGAISTLERIPTAPAADLREALAEVIYLLQGACETR